MKNHFVADVHGTKKVGRFAKSVARDFPEQGAILLALLLRPKKTNIQ